MSIFDQPIAFICEYLTGWTIIIFIAIIIYFVALRNYYIKKEEFYTTNYQELIKNTDIDEVMRSINRDENGESDENDESDTYEEGFRGSEYIEHTFFKKILLSLLITFMGYILILSSINNLIPISTYAPHLKQFKHLIYGFVFFLITYLCLEVF